MINDRLVELDKEIQQHLINWKKDEYFKTLPKDLQKKIKQFIQYFSFLRNSDGTLPLFQTQEKQDPKKKNFKLFLYLYNKYYKQVCCMESVEKMNGAHIKIHQAQVNNIVQQGIDLNMYLDWVFHVFLQDKFNQKFMPPTIKFVLGSFVFGKFLYANKAQIEQKKKNDLLLTQKQQLNDILIDAYKTTQIGQFGSLVRKLTANEITINKAISEAKQLCSVHNCMDYITKIEQIKK